MKKLLWFSILAVLTLALLTGCGELGQVDQGRVIEFNKEKGTVTLIKDVKADPQKPEYTELPPHVYEVPKDPGEMGPEPKAGMRMKLDTKNLEIVIFDKASQNFKTIKYTLLDQKEGIARDNPLVKDKKFPMVDREKKTITVYSGRQKIMTTFNVPDEYFAYPDSTWEAGDEVRIYYHQPGKAQRLMNISKTDIFKK